MKTLIKNLKQIVCLSVILTTSQFANAGVSSDVGPGNGGGNGGDGFLMQELKAANPGLSALEIILKAFNDSEGRVPNLYRLEDSNKFYFSPVEDKNDVKKIKGIEIKAKKLEVREIKATLACKNLDLGPLLSEVEPNCQLYSFESSRGFHENKLQKTSTGLTAMFNVDNNKYAAKAFEFRKLSEAEVVFIKYSTDKFDGRDVCYDPYIDRPYGAVNGICAAGYIWNEK